MSLQNPQRAYAWKYKQIVLDQNPPVLNTLHEVINETGGVKLIAIDVVQTNTPTNAEEIDIVVTLDGTAYTYDASVIGTLANNTQYSVVMHTDDPVGRAAYAMDIVDIAGLGYQKLFSNLYAASEQGIPIENHTVKVEVRQTSAIAAGARIRVKCTYAVLEAI